MRTVARILVVIGLGVLIASFGGDLHPLGDSLAVFRVAILGGVLLMALAVWRWRVAQGAVLLCAALIGSTVAQSMPEALVQPADLVLYQKNLLYLTRDRAGFVDDVLASGADFVTLQEVSPANRFLLDELREAYPYQLPCDVRTRSGVAVLSRWPVVGDACFRREGLAGGLFDRNGVQVRVIGVHLPWPWPRRQGTYVDALLADFGPLSGDVTLVGGDFNMVPAGRSVARIARATGTARVGHIERTFEVMGYPIAIDHVLASVGAVGTIEVRPQLGSDHFGVVARVALP